MQTVNQEAVLMSIAFCLCQNLTENMKRLSDQTGELKDILDALSTGDKEVVKKFSSEALKYIETTQEHLQEIQEILQ